MMKAKPYTLLTVRMPTDLQNVLETISAEKGESVSTIVRDMVRKVAVDVRRVDLGVSPASGPNAKDFR
jgi:predicted DNA-binding protein